MLCNGFRVISDACNYILNKTSCELPKCERSDFACISISAGGW